MEDKTMSENNRFPDVNEIFGNVTTLVTEPAADVTNVEAPEKELPAVNEFKNETSNVEKATNTTKETAALQESALVASGRNQNEVSETVKENIVDLAVKNASAMVSVDNNEFDDDRDAELVGELERQKRMGALIPVNEYTPLFKFNDGSAIMAKRNVYKGNKCDVTVMFVYNDGSEPSYMKISSVELNEIELGNFGREPEDGDYSKFSKEDVAEARKNIKNIRKRMFELKKLDYNIQPIVVVMSISNNYYNLIEDKTLVPDVNVIYSYIIKMAEEQAKLPYGVYMHRKTFYAFKEEDFRVIATRFGFNVKELAIYLKDNNLLHMQPGNMGYQCNVKGVDENCYCVKMFTSRIGKVDVEDISADPKELYKTM